LTEPHKKIVAQNYGLFFINELKTQFLSVYYATSCLEQRPGSAIGSQKSEVGRPKSFKSHSVAILSIQIFANCQLQSANSPRPASDFRLPTSDFRPQALTSN
jgi:hypothetical protein